MWKITHDYISIMSNQVGVQTPDFDIDEAIKEEGKMKNTMTVLKGSGLNADTIEIVVENGGCKVFEEKYYYGYDVSYHPAFVSKDKPLDTELIKEKAEEYGVAIEDVKYGEGRNLFKESMVTAGKGRDFYGKKNKYI